MTLRALVLSSLLLVPLTATAQFPLDGLRFRVDADHGHVDETARVLPVRVTVTNPALTDATQVRIRFGVPSIILDAGGNGWTCSGGGNNPTVCNFDGTLAAGASSTFSGNLYYAVPPFRVHIDGNVLWSDAAGKQQVSYDQSSVALYRRFVVTRGGDSGAGSLREAITALNADPVCATQPCGIEFNIAPAGAATKWQTITVHSPLPPLTGADVTIDGETQTAYSGDTNPDGPEIELLGAGVAGEGLEFRSKYVDVQSIAVGGFDRNGILMTVPPRTSAAFRFERNYLGTDATGAVAVPNGLRGLMITAGYLSGDIRANVLSGNSRSGLFVLSQQSPGFSLVPSMRVTENRVGVAAHSDAALPNGASGMFFGPETDGAAVERNVIAHNGDFGVAIARGSRIVRVRANSIYSNGVGGIDIGLDGPTPEGTPDPYRGELVAPLLQSATYDAATNTTTITGTGPFYLGFISHQVDFYVSDSRDHGEFAEGERFLGTVSAPTPQFGVPFPFTFTVAGDLRGKFISAVSLRIVDVDGSLIYDTSEFSRAVEVR